MSPFKKDVNSDGVMNERDVSDSWVWLRLRAPIGGEKSTRNRGR